MRGLQSRGYIAECFRAAYYLLFASGVYMQCLLGKLRTPKFAQIVAYTMLTHDTSDLNQKRPKMRHFAQGCAFLGDGGLNDVPLSFGS